MLTNNKLMENIFFAILSKNSDSRKPSEITIYKAYFNF